MSEIRSPRRVAATWGAALSCALVAAGCTGVRETQSPVARAPQAERHVEASSQRAGCARAPYTEADGPRGGQSYIDWARSRSGQCCAAPGDRPRPSLRDMLGNPAGRR